MNGRWEMFFSWVLKISDFIFHSLHGWLVRKIIPYSFRSIILYFLPMTVPWHWVIKWVIYWFQRHSEHCRADVDTRDIFDNRSDGWGAMVLPTGIQKTKTLGAILVSDFVSVDNSWQIEKFISWHWGSVTDSLGVISNFLRCFWELADWKLTGSIQSNWYCDVSLLSKSVLKFHQAFWKSKDRHKLWEVSQCSI